MMSHDLQQLNALSKRALKVLGSEQMKSLVQSRPRLSVYSKAISLAIKGMGSPDKVTDEQILGALKIAHEVYPLELETISAAMKGENKSGAL